MTAPTYPQTADVSSSQPTLASQYNNLRKDAIYLGAGSTDATTTGNLLKAYTKGLVLTFFNSFVSLQTQANANYNRVANVNGRNLVVVNSTVSAYGLADGTYFVNLVWPGASTGFNLALSLTESYTDDIMTIARVWVRSGIPVPSSLVYVMQPDIQYKVHNEDNLLINSTFRFWQRQTPGTATIRLDDAYGPDRWYVLTENAAGCQVQRVAGLQQQYACRLTQNVAGSFKIALAQIIPSADCIHLRGQEVSLSGLLQMNQYRQIKVAVLEWTGTADAVTSDVISAWNATAVNPTFIANVSGTLMTETISDANGAAIHHRVQLGTTFNNLIVLVISHQTMPQNETLTIEALKLQIGNMCTPLVPLPYQEELRRCQHFYQKSFAIETAPAQNAGAGIGEIRFMAITAGATVQRPGWPLPVTMRATPGTVTLYNPSAANAQVRDTGGSVDCSSSSITANANTLYITTTGNAATAVGNALAVHYTLDAEL